MDHNNKHLLPGFQFPTAFAGFANANVGANANASLLSALSHLSLPTALLPTTINPTELAQWAAAQQTNQQAWLDQAKVAAMLPSLAYLTSVADVKNLALAQQTLQSSVVNGSTSSNIFPTLTLKQLQQVQAPSPTFIPTSKFLPEVVESPVAVEPLSNASSSHQSTSTPQEIDVGTIAPYSQILSLDAVESSPPIVVVAQKNGAPPAAVCEPSTSGVKTVTKAKRLMANAELLKLNPAPSGLYERRAGPKRSQSEMIIPIAQSLVAGVPPPSAPPIKRGPDEEHDDHDIDGLIYDLQPELQHDESAVPATFGLFGENAYDGGLSPVQFTPPDSPTREEPRPTPAPTPALPLTNHVSFPPAPCPTPALPLAPLPKPIPRHISLKEAFKTPVTSVSAVKKQPFQAKPVNNKSKNVPIYKQKRLGIYKMDTVADKDTTADAYSFEDEEEHSLAKIESTKDKLDQEVREKLSKIAAQPGDKNKNVYVPGIGFAVPQEQPHQDLWRNVVLKKRPVENRPAVPSANLLPASAHVEACQAAARLAEPEIVTLAESLRRRKKNRYVCAFIKTEVVSPLDNTSFKEEGNDTKYFEFYQSVDVVPKLPKLVIKLPKKPSEVKQEKEPQDKKKKKKKRKREEDDSDWEGAKKTTKKHKGREKRKKSEKRESGYEIRIVEQEGFLEDMKPPRPPTPPPVLVPVKEEKQPVPFNRKKQIMQQWEEETQQQAQALALLAQEALKDEIKQENGHPPLPPGLEYNGTPGDKPILKKYPSEFNADAIKQRLSKFSQADGNVTKGSFVVNKSELFREDCALWKVDNPNMLQKFPPKVDPTTKNISYKSSSTYSGWCEQISSGYFKVAVRFIKQSRSESIVEPEVPLADLFPAMTSEGADNNGVIIPEEEVKPDPNEHVNILRDQRKMSLYILNKEIIDHALTLEHLQKVKNKSDWNFLKALTDVDKINNDCMVKLRTTINIREELEELIKDYSKLIVSNTKIEASGFICLTCQSCKSDKKPVEKVVHLLGRQGYDRETLQYAVKNREKPKEDEEVDVEPLIATELYLCDACATAVEQFHRCYHMFFDLLRYSEDKLESLGTLHSDYKPEILVEMAKKLRTWQSRLFNDIIDMWKRIENYGPASVATTVHPITT